MSVSAASTIMHQKVMLLFKHYLGERNLSNCFWPRAARDLMLQLLTMAERQGVAVDRELVRQLRSSTNNWIQKKYRSDISKIIALCVKLTWIPVVPMSEESQRHANAEWPELQTLSDISADPFRPVLREEIMKWLRDNGPWKDSRILAFSYEPEALKPVIILTANEDSASLWNLNLAMLSDELSRRFSFLLPKDICSARPLGYKIGPVGMADASSPDEGTIGAWITMNNKRYGITCAHVAPATARSLQLLIAERFSATENGADIALMEVVSCSDCQTKDTCIGCGCLCHLIATMRQNTLHLRSLDALEALLEKDSPLKPGVDVYKCGGTVTSTGKLRFNNVTTDAAWFGKPYHHAYVVEWDSQSDSPFAVDGDCGSLYAVKVAESFLPFALHVSSNIGPVKSWSVGIDLIRCKEQLDIKYGCQRWSFGESSTPASAPALANRVKQEAAAAAGSHSLLDENESALQKTN